MKSQSGRKRLVFLLISVVSMAGLSCGVPNLESPECSEARVAIREVYSFHFGNDMRPSPENIELRSRFVTPTFKEFLKQSYVNLHDVKPVDEFTKTINDPPKAFRVGKCTLDETKSIADAEVILFWKDDTRDKQRTIKVTMIRDGAKWLINEITLIPE